MMSTSLSVSVPLEPSIEVNTIDNQEVAIENELKKYEPDKKCFQEQRQQQRLGDDAGLSRDASGSYRENELHSARCNIFSHINSGPMSEGHIPLYNVNQSSDQSINICLFTRCLFLVGFATLSLGLFMYSRQKLTIVSVFLITFGSFSAGSAVFYAAIYFLMLGMRQARSMQEQQQQQQQQKSPFGKSNGIKSNYEPASTNSSANYQAHFDQFGSFDEQTEPIAASADTTIVTNGSIYADINEGKGLCGSTYIPPRSPTVQLNVDNLDMELQSTKNLDESNWRTVNGELPQNYLKSFGDLQSGDTLSSSTHINEQSLKHSSSPSRHSSWKTSKKRRIFDSLRNGQPFSIASQGKSGSQTKLLESENEGENTLFYAKTIGKDEQVQQNNVEICSGGSDQSTNKELQEEITLVPKNILRNLSSSSTEIIVHFNRNNNAHTNMLH